ncbi:MAG: hypothetical protein WBX11_15215 [Thiobacillaceae bacterium]
MADLNNSTCLVEVLTRTSNAERTQYFTERGGAPTHIETLALEYLRTALQAAEADIGRLFDRWTVYYVMLLSQASTPREQALLNLTDCGMEALLG